MQHSMLGILLFFLSLLRLGDMIDDDTRTDRWENRQIGKSVPEWSRARSSRRIRLLHYDLGPIRLSDMQIIPGDLSQSFFSGLTGGSVWRQAVCCWLSARGPTFNGCCFPVRWIAWLAEKIDGGQLEGGWRGEGGGIAAGVELRNC